MITYEVRGLEELIVKYTGAPDAIQGRLIGALSIEVKALEDEIRNRMASLFSNPEKMQKTLSSDVTFLGNEGAVATITASGLPYLAIQEYGGTVQTPEMFSAPGKAMMFSDARRLNFFGAFTPETGTTIFTKHTKAHPTTLPERSYMRSSLAERKGAILDAIRQAVGEALA